MGTTMLRARAAATWALVECQHGVIARWQLLALGYSPEAIKHRLGKGRLHAVHRGVYAVGRPELSQAGRWMAAVLAASEGAVLSHGSAAELWGFRPFAGKPIEVCVPPRLWRRRDGIHIHRGKVGASELTEYRRIPVVGIVTTFLQIAPRLGLGELERAINEADRLDLIDPESLRTALEGFSGRRGVRPMRVALDRRTFAMSRSELERRFRPIARRVGLPMPQTCVMRNGFEVDFLWPDLRLVVETDSLRYHRTPAQQARDRQRDHAHQAAGDLPLRFTHSQVRYEPAHVERTLRRVVEILRSQAQR